MIHALITSMPSLITLIRLQPMQSYTAAILWFAMHRSHTPCSTTTISTPSINQTWQNLPHPHRSHHVQPAAHPSKWLCSMSSLTSKLSPVSSIHRAILPPQRLLLVLAAAETALPRFAPRHARSYGCRPFNWLLLLMVYPRLSC